ncbi:MAG: response regulator [Roseibium sp.]|uniref:response regulator n=1 Tax=Roseibium sp. TaxID=1936156 RepID=UPI00260CD621|nr:response regulator [Roseibium sp.]MCV0424291.1 response regulator [Roseibium sp.]
MLVHIVEDDEAVADALALALADLDHLPKIYEDGETFLEQADLLASHCVIVDLGLPGMSGADIVKKLRKQPDPPNIIVISGKSRVKLMRHLNEVPELTVLRKPLSMEMLASAMAKIGRGVAKPRST